MNSKLSKKQNILQEVKKPENPSLKEQEVLELIKLGYTYENACAVISKRKMEELFDRLAN